MKAYTEAVYATVRWFFIIGAVVFLIFGAVFALNILSSAGSPYSWIDVAMSGVASLGSFGGSFFVSMVRRIHNAAMDRWPFNLLALAQEIAGLVVR